MSFDSHSGRACEANGEGLARDHNVLLYDYLLHITIVIPDTFLRAQRGQMILLVLFAHDLRRFQSQEGLNKCGQTINCRR